MDLRDYIERKLAGKSTIIETWVPRAFSFVFVVAVSLCLAVLVRCTGVRWEPPKPKPDYMIKIQRYQDRDDLTMREKQMLYMAEKKRDAVQGNIKNGR